VCGLCPRSCRHPVDGSRSLRYSHRTASCISSRRPHTMYATVAIRSQQGPRVAMQDLVGTNLKRQIDGKGSRLAQPELLANYTSAEARAAHWRDLCCRQLCSQHITSGTIPLLRLAYPLLFGLVHPIGCAACCTEFQEKTKQIKLSW
jgi:hypothetical protein